MITKSILYRSHNYFLAEFKFFNEVQAKKLYDSAYIYDSFCIQ